MIYQIIDNNLIYERTKYCECRPYRFIINFFTAHTSFSQLFYVNNNHGAAFRRGSNFNTNFKNWKTIQCLSNDDWIPFSEVETIIWSVLSFVAGLKSVRILLMLRSTSGHVVWLQWFKQLTDILNICWINLLFTFESNWYVNDTRNYRKFPTYKRLGPVVN